MVRMGNTTEENNTTDTGRKNWCIYRRPFVPAFTVICVDFFFLLLILIRASYLDVSTYRQPNHNQPAAADKHADNTRALRSPKIEICRRSPLVTALTRRVRQL